MCDSDVACFQSQHQCSFLTNEFDVQSVLHGKVSLAAVGQIYVFHEAMNICKNLKDSLKVCFENVNIYKTMMLYPFHSGYW